MPGEYCETRDTPSFRQVPRALSTFLSQEPPPGTSRTSVVILLPADKRPFHFASFPKCLAQQNSCDQDPKPTELAGVWEVGMKHWALGAVARGLLSPHSARTLSSHML